MKSTLLAGFLLSICSIAMAAGPKFSTTQISGTEKSVVAVIANRDFDGDGHKDVLIADHDSGLVSIYRNIDGTGTHLVKSLAYAGYAGNLSGAAAGNLTHSGTAGGLPDLVVATGGGIVVVQNLGLVSGSLAFSATTSYSTSVGYLYGVDVADLNGDGYDDIVASCQTYSTHGAKLAVFINKGAAGPGFYDPVFYDTTAVYAAPISVGDLNGDGRPDVVMGGLANDPSTNRNRSCAIISMNNGDGSMRPAQTYFIQSNLTSARVGNVAGHLDGRSDVMLTGAELFSTNGTTIYENETLEVLVNRGDDSFFKTQAYFVGTLGTISSVGAVPGGGAAILSYGTNGTANVAVASHVDGAVVIAGFTPGYDAQGRFDSLKLAPASASLIKTTEQTSLVDVGDLNGDRRPDLVSGVFSAKGGPAATGATTATVLIGDTASPLAPELRVGVSVDAQDGMALSGSAVIYTIAYRNNGLIEAQGVNLGVYYGPLGVFVSGSGNPGPTVIPGSKKTLLKWSIGNVPATSGSSVTFKVQIPANASIGAKISGQAAILEGLKIADSAPLPKVTVENPLRLTLLATPDANSSGSTVAASGTVTYTLQYRNDGASNIDGVKLAANLPAKTAIVMTNGQPDDSGGILSTKGGTQKVSWIIGTLLPGASGSVMFRVTVNAKVNTSITGMARADATALPAVKESYPPLLVQ